LIQIPELDTFFVHDRSVRESGHDTTYRWDLNGNRCADFVTVDLNALLYKIEIDIGTMIQKIFFDRLVRDDGTVEMSSQWFERAEKRKERMLRYLWNEDAHLFFDYDFVQNTQSAYVSATALYPLWACDPQNPATKIVTESQAKKLVCSVLGQLEMAGGVVASAKASRGKLSEDRPQRQWDYPYGWAPHQMLIWQGLVHYGMDATAHRLIYKWLYTILRNAADYNGMIPEKFDVVKRSHEVFAEYGNVGTEFDYITQEGFGWMNASYQVGLGLLPNAYKTSLEQLIPPEWIFESYRE
jgi:alpha,alpha-trehalase